ncbi:MAG: leucine-rich repeat domain-containing protein, partial [Treponema sp.]|nr:leucine-rich repeat domain-containing protein [Treponema sp.]
MRVFEGKIASTFVLMTVMAITAYAQQYDPESDFRTAPINGGKAVAITKYVGPKQTVSIPPTIKTLPVASIGSWAFYESTSLNSIILPNSVTSIEEGAFAGCTRLASITIPNSVTTIGEWAFADTMLTSINIPNSVTTIVNGAFLGCTSLTAINVAA